MDNGLIFPYRQQPPMTNLVMLSAQSSPIPEKRPRERATRAGSSQAWGDGGKVSNPGDGCCWVRTGGGLGKSGPSHMTLRPDAKPVWAKWVILCCRENL